MPKMQRALLGLKGRQKNQVNLKKNQPFLGCHGYGFIIQDGCYGLPRKPQGLPSIPIRQEAFCQSTCPPWEQGRGPDLPLGRGGGEQRAAWPCSQQRQTQFYQRVVAPNQPLTATQVSPQAPHPVVVKMVTETACLPAPSSGCLAVDCLCIGRFHSQASGLRSSISFLIPQPKSSQTLRKGESGARLPHSSLCSSHAPHFPNTQSKVTYRKTVFNRQIDTEQR